MAKRKIYPSLWLLYKDNLLPENTFFLGYARTNLDIKEFLKKHVTQIKSEENEMFHSFVARNYFLQGDYDKRDDFKKLNDKIFEITRANACAKEKTSNCNRIFYLAVPPSVYETALEMLSMTCKAASVNQNFTRVVIEKPFGKDLNSSNKLSIHLGKLFDEEQIYRIDHYLGKEMVQNLLVLRFSNMMFSRLWNRDSIECVMITFKESIGVEGRGGYFDEFGIVRDIMQNHLLQIVSLIAMERPNSNSPDEIRNEKV